MAGRPSLIRPTPPKVWITRAQPGADATAARVRALGHEALIAPLLAVRMLPDVEISLTGVGALAFTSGAGVRAFAAACEERALPVFAVGAATAEAARRAGFGEVRSADGDVSDLAEAIAAHRESIEGLVLHPGAAELAGDLAGALARAEIGARALTLYETLPLPLSPNLVGQLSTVDVALVHSAKGGRALAAVLQAHPQPHLRLLAISEAALAPLAQTLAAAKAAAAFPLEAALLNLLDLES